MHSAKAYVATPVELMTTDDDTLLWRYIPYSWSFDAVAFVRVFGRREYVSGLADRSSSAVTLYHLMSPVVCLWVGGQRTGKRQSALPLPQNIITNNEGLSYKKLKTLRYDTIRKVFLHNFYLPET